MSGHPAPALDAMTLDHFLKQAWAEHGDATEAVAQRLAESTALITEAAQAAPYARIVVHVYGEHLGRWPQGIALLHTLRRRPGGGEPAARQAIDRSIATLRHAAGEAGAVDALPPEERVQALAGAAAILIERGSAGEAIGALDAALAQASALELAPGSPVARSLGVAGNNIADALEKRESLDASLTAAMLRAADAGLRYWRIAGTWLEEERAWYELARCQLRAGQPAEAAASAQRCIDVCAANDAPAFERFFGAAVHALACRDRGDPAGFEASRAAALHEYAQVPEDERGWCKREHGELGG
jgi:hypothetical protein